jgi:hypothetical protein
MKNTAALTALSHLGQAENTIVIHPNDGFDLGLLTLKREIRIFSNMTMDQFQARSAGFMQGIIILENRCKLGTIELNPGFWKKIGRPKSIQLFIEDDGLLLKTDE